MLKFSDICQCYTCTRAENCEVKRCIRPCAVCIFDLEHYSNCKDYIKGGNK